MFNNIEQKFLAKFARARTLMALDVMATAAELKANEVTRRSIARAYVIREEELLRELDAARLTDHTS